MRKLAKAVALASAAALVLVGCSAGEEKGTDAPDESSSEALVIDGETIADGELYAAAMDEGVLSLYDNYPEAPWRALLDVFEEDTGITVDHVRLITPQLYERVVSEAGANKLGADAIGMGDPTLMQDLSKRGILAPYESPVGLSALKPGEYTEDHTMYSSARLVMLPAYNTEVLAEDGLDAPTSWNDFLEPEWAGKIGGTPISTGGSAFSVYYFMDSGLGDDYWTGYAANSPIMYDSVVPLTQDIVRGEVPLGITSLGTIAEQVAKGAPVKPLFLSEGTPAFTNLVAVTEAGEHPNAARVYLNWLLSRHGQNVLVEKTSEYPIRSDADAPAIPGVDMPAPGSGEITVPPLEVWTESRDSLTEEWNDVFHG
ncbi:ABC transporter substrate-binding protein [Microbacterium soli]|uniref:ABC transporter substrate-binding protein n=1 Tax=Microbacterium soli TaxID=446075 RepID=A0ABP7MTA9_9MICO